MRNGKQSQVQSSVKAQTIRKHKTSVNVTNLENCIEKCTYTSLTDAEVLAKSLS